MTPEPATADAPPRPRAAAMSAPERRAEIVAATLPLLLAHGPAVTTRQIAEAAGIAEGTIFRVFPDKDTLIAAVVEQALDSTAVDAALAAIDPTLPLEDRLVEAVGILRRRFADVHQLRTALGADLVQPASKADLTALVAVFEPDRTAIRRDPADAAHLLRGFTIAGTHPAITLDEPLSSEEIVSLFLDGVRARAGAPDERGDRC